MTTSRTGTTQWKRVAAQAIAEAKAQGITHCPACSIELDYEHRANDNGATVDHVVSHARGGEDAIENTAILCKRCNASKGAGWATEANPYPLSRAW